MCSEAFKRAVCLGPPRLRPHIWKPQRRYCAKCGGHLLANHPTLDMVDVFAATLPSLKFTPGVHVNYAETVLPMRDGLPKLKDFPAEFGGSGEMMTE